MRKTILILLSSLILIGMSAQTNMTSISKNELKTNEIDSRDGDIMITPKSMITSSNVLLYDIKDFFKVYDAQDKELIGCPVICQVLQVRKSNIMGSEGRLVIRPLYIKKGDEKINVFGDIYARGLNRTNVKFWLTFLPPIIFIPGTGAKIYPNDLYPIYLR